MILITVILIMFKYIQDHSPLPALLFQSSPISLQMCILPKKYQDWRDGSAIKG